MTRAQAARAGGGARKLVGWMVRLALALVLVAGWAAWELHAASTRAVAHLEDVTALAVEQFDAFLGRFSGVSGQFAAAAAAPHNRIGVTVRMLKAEPLLAPAENLFLYDATGHFVAATLPLLPADADLSGRTWFEATAAHPGVPTLIATAAAPLGQGAGFVVSQSISDPAGKVAGVIGTFLQAAALRRLITPPALPAGASVRLSQAGGGAALLHFSAGTAAPHPRLAAALEWIGGMPRIGEIADLPGGLDLRIDADVFADVTVADRRIVLEHAAALLIAIVFFLWLFRPRRRQAVTFSAREERGVPAPELEWGWEIDSRGRLVGVAGNAPTALLSAVGTNFLDLVAGDARGSDLRAAIAERTPVRDLELSIILPGSSPAAPRRFRVSGRYVADTGGFWGTAEEVQTLQPVKEAAD
ncbi:MAG: hypothetical protein ACREFP_25055 [Acetobacteraceae bacterium]